MAIFVNYCQNLGAAKCSLRVESAGLGGRQRTGPAGFISSSLWVSVSPLARETTSLAPCGVAEFWEGSPAHQRPRLAPAYIPARLSSLAFPVFSFLLLFWAVP